MVHASQRAEAGLYRIVCTLQGKLKHPLKRYVLKFPLIRKKYETLSFETFSIEKGDRLH
jgi:hypothetical protein